MSILWIVGLTVVFGFNLAVYLRLNAKKTKIIGSLFNAVEQMRPNQATEAVLLVDPHLAADTESHIAQLPPGWVILFNGPEWLYAIKRRKWGQRCLLAQQVLGERKLNLLKGQMAIMKRDERYTQFYEIAPLIKFKSGQGA
ncbi:hypothetical protein ACFFSY_00450 [Paenibacillus aurantiacus]|uniref:Uncharacterized protein n=1 Tax=Paenibacillus aurantiacus TaxID=1936118 RepID=A0ABV5KGQ8_9BACL